MARKHDPTKRLIKQDTKSQRHYADLRYYGGSKREALVAPGETGATRDLDKAIAAYDRRVEALKASQRALAAQPVVQSASGPRVDPHAPGPYAGRHLLKKRESGKVRDMKEYEQRLNYVMSLAPIARLRHVTEIDYAVVSEVIACLGSTPITAVRSTKQGMRRAPRTIHNYLSPFSDMLERARRERLIPSNPVRGHEDLPSTADEIPREALEYHEAVALLEAFDRMPQKNGNFPYGKAVAALMLLAGLRRSEVFSLAPRDIDFARREIAVRKAARGKKSGKVEQRTTKTPGSTRYVKICRQLEEILRELFQRFDPRGAYLFPKWVGEGVSRMEEKFDDCDDTLKAAYAFAGITKGSPSHTLRHTFITHMFNVIDEDGNYPNARYIAGQAGHANEHMVRQRYGHLLEYDVKLVGELRFVRDLIPAERLTAFTAAA